MERSEWVYVEKVLNDDDQALVTRQNGETWLIEKGVGCLSLWAKEGSSILMTYPGSFGGSGASLVIPDRDQMCRVWNADEVRSFNSVYLTRVAQDVYRDSAGRVFRTFACYEYAYSDDAVIYLTRSGRAKIHFGRRSCDLAA